MKRVLLSLAILSGLAFGQANQSNFPSGTSIPFAGVPGGSCTATQTAVNTTNGALYTCNAGSWQLATGSTAVSGLTGNVKGLPLSGAGTTGANPSPIYLDPSQFDSTPLTPTTPCPDIVTAEGTGVNGNFAVPDMALGLSTGTPFPCTVNPVGTARNGPLLMPSATLQLQSAAAIQGTSAAGTGPTNVIGTGHKGNCGSNGQCATWLQKQIGMAHVQMGQVSISPATPAVVTGCLTVGAGDNTCAEGVTPSGQQMYPIFNTSWAGLQFNVVNPTSGAIVSQIIPSGGVSCTFAANTYPCSTTNHITLGAAWTGTGSVTSPASCVANCVLQNYFLSYPGTVQVSATGLVTGTNTHFDASWVGTTFNAAPAASRGSNCAGPTTCTIASVTSATSMQLSANWSGSVASGLPYELGTVYGPVISMGQAALPIIEGSSFENMTIDPNVSAQLDGSTAVASYFEQEMGALRKIGVQSWGAAGVDIGGGPGFDESANSGPWVDFEVVAGSMPTVINPVAASLVTSGAQTIAPEYTTNYPGVMGYAVITFSAAPTPAPARGMDAWCTSIPNGATHATVFSAAGTGSYWRVIDQITPTSVLIFMALPTDSGGGTDTSNGAGGSCTFLSKTVNLANHPFYRGRGFQNATANPVGWSYTSNKANTYHGSGPSANLLSDFDFAGGASSNTQNLFGQAADVPFVFGEKGVIRGANFIGLENGQGVCGAAGGCEPTASTVAAISSQFTNTGVSPQYCGVTSTNIFGLFGGSSFPNAPTTTLVDECNTNTFPYGAQGAGNPDIGVYILDSRGWPAFSDASISLGAPTINNGFFSHVKDGLNLFIGGTTAVWGVNPNGAMHENECLSATAGTGTPSPAACGSASTGKVAMPASITTYQVNTSAITANSLIFINQITDNSGLPNTPTCGSTTVGLNPVLTLSRTAGTDFVLTITSVAQVTCFQYWIVN
jgi:hypothetical protein